MASKKQKLQDLEKTLTETSDIALLRRDLNTMVHTLTQTLKGVITVMQDLSEAVEGISRSGNTTTIDGDVLATGNLIAALEAKPKTAKKAPVKKPVAKRTVKKSINLDPK